MGITSCLLNKLICDGRLSEPESIIGQLTMKVTHVYTVAMHKPTTSMVGPNTLNTTVSSTQISVHLHTLNSAAKIDTLTLRRTVIESFIEDIPQLWPVSKGFL